MSAAMMLRLSFDLNAEADAVEKAVEKAIADGCRTKDIAARNAPFLTTSRMTAEIISRL
jgi:3-isopropylmalate dehydrogenase